MIVGARNRDMNDLWYAQAVKNPEGNTVPNAAIESILKMDDLQDEGSTRPGLWLESCKCHSMYNATLATRIDPRGFEGDLRQRLRGARSPDYLCIWMNTPQNRAQLGISPSDTIMPNERSELYPLAMAICFGVVNHYRPTHGWDDLVTLLQNGNAVVGSQIVGHSIMFKGYDDETGLLIYVDPYAARQPRTWKDMHMDRATHDSEIKPFINVFPEEC